MAAAPLVALKGAAVAPGPAGALAPLDLSLSAGARLLVTGPSGSGKTTLLKLLAGLRRPTAGRIDWAGGRAPARAMAFERDALLDSESLLENVLLPLRRLPREAALARGRAALRSVGLAASDEEKRPQELSGGMRKRAGIARALASGAPVRIFDEPAAGLDPVTAREIGALLSAPAEGLLVVGAADPGPLWELVDLGLVLEPGRPARLGPRDVIRARWETLT